MASHINDAIDLHDFGTIFSLEGKVALVTGGSRGLGLSAASGLLQAGCSKVCITSRNIDECQSAATALNMLPKKRPDAVAIAIKCDLRDASSIDSLIRQLSEASDHIDIIFANAGIAFREPFETHNESMFREVLEVNVDSVFHLARKSLKLLSAKATKEEPSRIIVSASVYGLIAGTPAELGLFSYSVSKSAVIHLSQMLAVELGPHHVLSNAIAPGYFPSQMGDPLIEARGGSESLAQKTPNRRLGRPEDIAGLVVFLASRAASHINGAIITSDGGSLAKGNAF